MTIEEIYDIIEKKSIPLLADKLKDNSRYMWVVSQSVFDKIRKDCDLDIDKMNEKFYNIECHVNHKWFDDNIKLWKEL